MKHTEKIAPITESDLAIGYSDVIEEVPSEFHRVAAANSEALRDLPGERSVQVTVDMR